MHQLSSLEYYAVHIGEKELKNESFCYLMDNNKNIPDFFIVGAPKSGTTALDHHLNLHPEIFMAKKEIHYFGSDIGIIQDPLNENEYLSYFDESTEKQLKGESSVWYLYSKKAAEEIKQFNPNAKIIILLRKPSEMIPSLHSQYLFNGIESEEDLTKAFNIDLKRALNNEVLPCNYFENRPPYINSVKYFEQVNQYFEVFEKENILILLHEDLLNNFDHTFKNVLEFLNVNDTEFSPEIEKVNIRRNIKNVKVHQLSKSPPSGLKKLFRAIIPIKSVRHSIMKNVDNINIKAQKETKIPVGIKNKIIELTSADINKLEQLIQKDLSAWVK